MVAEELLQPIISRAERHEDLMSILEKESTKSRTAKVWVENLIKPVLIMMIYVRAEREAEWSLHIWAMQQMIPYFFAAGHVNYDRYGLYYMRSMERLPGNVLKRCLNGEHVMKHNPGVWNGIWSYIFIETTFMRYGKGPGCLVGVTLKPSTVKRWALSLHTTSRVESDIDEMRYVQRTREETTHKEEMSGRIASDANDRGDIQQKLEMCIDPFNSDNHPDGIVNIVTGRIAPDIVNVDNSVAMGKEQMKQFDTGWPATFYEPLSNKVVTMSVTKKRVKLGSADCFDTNLIYSRVMGLMSSRDIDLKDVFSHKLAPVPASMFEYSGDMRITKSKSTLKRKLQVEQSSRTQTM